MQNCRCQYCSRYYGRHRARWNGIFTIWISLISIIWSFFVLQKRHNLFNLSSRHSHLRRAANENNFFSFIMLSASRFHLSVLFWELVQNKPSRIMILNEWPYLRASWTAKQSQGDLGITCVDIEECNLTWNFPCATWAALTLEFWTGGIVVMPVMQERYAWQWNWIHKTLFVGKVVFRSHASLRSSSSAAEYDSFVCRTVNALQAERCRKHLSLPSRLLTTACDLVWLSNRIVISSSWWISCG